MSWVNALSFEELKEDENENENEGSVEWILQAGWPFALTGAQGDHRPITLALQLSAPVTSRDRRPARRARGGLIDIRKSQNAAEPMDNLHLSVDSWSCAAPAHCQIWLPTG